MLIQSWWSLVKVLRLRITIGITDILERMWYPTRIIGDDFVYMQDNVQPRLN